MSNQISHRRFLWKIMIPLFSLFFFYSTRIQASPIHWSIKTLTKVVDTKTMRPGSPDFFTHFDKPYLYDGKMVFRGFNGRRKTGIYTVSSGALQLVMNNTIQPYNDRRKFLSFGKSLLPSDFNIPILDKKGVLFFGNGSGNGLTGIYYVAKKKLIPLVTEETIIPGGTKGLFTTFRDPSFINKHIVFIGEGEKGLLGIYKTNKKGKGEIETLIDKTTFIPNGHPYNTFQVLSHLTSARDGRSDDFIFIGQGNKKQFGLYRYHKGKILKIADQSTAIPEGVGYLKQIENPIFDDKTDQILFIGRGVLGQVGIYSYHEDKLMKIIDQKDVMPEDTDTFNNIHSISCDDDLLVFHAKGHEKQVGIYLHTKTGTFKILSENDTIEEKAIKALSLSQGAFNNKQLALRIRFMDDDEAIYLLTLERS